MVAEVVAPKSRSDGPGVGPPSIVHAGDGAELRRYSWATWTVIEVVGDIDLAVAPAIRKMLEEAPSSWVIFDLGGVRFMDASGLGVLADALNRARSMGGAVRLVNPCMRVAKILEIARLDRVLPTYASLEAATGQAR